MLLQVVEWLAGTSWSIALHESLYLYPLIESTHVLTLTVFVGLTVMLDLRLLGLAIFDGTLPVNTEVTSYMTGMLQRPARRTPNPRPGRVRTPQQQDDR